MGRGLLCLLMLVVVVCGVETKAAEYHVAPSGKDGNAGSSAAPLRTIQAAANKAQPGDTITVHEGVYRERVNPPRGGTSDEQRITYQAAPGEKAVITGSEIVAGWKKVTNDTWSVTLPNSFFGDFNPYSDILDGHWFRRGERIHHTGSVYLNGVWRGEAATLVDVLNPVGSDPLWFGEVSNEITTIWAQFPEADPNTVTVEINARQTVFMPDQPGINYITVRGFTLRHAATPWVPPTMKKQVGLICPNWSRGWIIEDNDISYATTVGILLGIKENLGEFPGTVVGMRMSFAAAEKVGWDQVGRHIIRRNRISHCESAGIKGNMSCAYSLIENNIISDIHVRRTFGGLDQGCIKLHGAIDTVIRGNIICRSGGEARALWLDWAGQGAILEGNILYDNANTDMYIEVTHGPCLVANNVMLSRRSYVSTSRGNAFVNNYFGGSMLFAKTTRDTPLAEPHSTRLVGLRSNDEPGDDRFLNNIFASSGELFLAGWGGMTKEDIPRLSFDMQGNVYLNGAIPPAADSNAVVLAGKPPIQLKQDGAAAVLEWTMDDAWRSTGSRPAVTGARLGLTRTGGLPFERPDGSPVLVDSDLLGTVRNQGNVMPGPFEVLTGRLELGVWPINKR